MCLVLSLPMRNWNPNAFLSSVNSNLFSAYLWGIETQFYHFRQTKLLSSQPTYEELKRNDATEMNTNQHVLSLPMRNWNRSIKANLGWKEKVLSLPMRNWNEENKLMLAQEDKGSQPTYEELKPDHGCDLATGYRCSQPTYEELKQYVADAVPNLKGSSQPTYEELKLESVPIFHRRFDEFSAYLWGIETIWWWDRGSNAIKVLSLPMRNWNP